MTSLVPLGLLAAGVSSLIEHSLLVEPPLERPPFVQSNGASFVIPDTQAILRRNPFDSATGPLDEVAAPEAPLPVNLDPLSAPSCGALSVYSTIESTDPYWSSAVIQGEHEVRGSVRHPGDRVEGSQVLYIGFNPHLRSPCVWFLANGQLCQSALFDGKPRRGTPAAKPAPRAGKRPNAKSPGRALPKSIADKIRRRSATEFDIDRGAVDAIFGDYSRLMRGTRVRPVNVDGKLVGLRLNGIRADSLLGQLGWRDGDQVQSINGFVLTSPDKALEAYARLRTADHLVVRVIRGGKQMSLDYRVR